MTKKNNSNGSWCEKEQTIKLNTVINDLESRKRMEKNMRVKNKIKHRNPELLRKELDKASFLAAFR